MRLATFDHAFRTPFVRTGHSDGPETPQHPSEHLLTSSSGFVHCRLLFAAWTASNVLVFGHWFSRAENKIPSPSLDVYSTIVGSMSQDREDQVDSGHTHGGVGKSRWIVYVSHLAGRPSNRNNSKDIVYYGYVLLRDVKVNS